MYKINLLYEVINPKYTRKETTHRFTGEKIIIHSGNEYFKPKVELIDFLNNELSQLVKTEKQKETLEKFFTERYFILCYSLPYKGSEYGSWTILKGKDDSILSYRFSISGMMEDMKPNYEIFIIKVNGEVEEFNKPIFENEFIECFKIYK
ncbi:hypothetical protein [Flavobacterium sp.]|uniref:hypothetical protein n=1 Tax=Flavobacterium sp. TaxID=239 RepID=UPI0026160D19|nr:hypothetical protein [Flavobacterium sp.]